MLNLRLIALLWFLLIGSSLGAQASHRPRPLTAAETEARNEAFVPSLPGQAREARRISLLLTDALLLTNAQQHAVESFTKAEQQALALATTPGQATQAQAEYRLAVYRVLDTHQLATYLALYQRLAGTAQAIDGTELAVR